ncbi:type II toxin-antitoxin system RelE/ParE family toxin [Scopulibacillus cellulosilyticus]|uniref:Type II toxin-antitoxin system RelE/ParE family toxin n=1 Tax=Scopulibacillus cellulosilyticus TaxID=2665665 RepID=A0ABW2Q2M8_9BACL
MQGENENGYSVMFTEEFSLCLDRIQSFFAKQEPDVLEWWYQKEDEIIDYIEKMLSSNPFIGTEVKNGIFKGLRQITYGKNRHRMLNYLIFYAVHENDRIIDVINILPSRSSRQRVRLNK